MKTLIAVAFSLGLILSFSAASAANDRPEYLASFDPAKGFKPAQRDLTEIFLQIAGSLEYYGSPLPYMRLMEKEHARIEALYQQKYGHAPKSFRPPYMTDEYLNRFSSNWDILSPKLGLEPFTKEVGNTMRDAIKGTRGTGTIIVEIFNQHQARVFDSMAGKSSRGADFETLKSDLVTRLELDKPKIDDSTYSIPRRDAVRSALIIHGLVLRLFVRLDQNLNATDAERIKNALTSVFIDVGRMAQSELEAGLSEWAFRHQSTAAR